MRTDEFLGWIELLLHMPQGIFIGNSYGILLIFVLEPIQSRDGWERFFLRGEAGRVMAKIFAGQGRGLNLRGGAPTAFLS